VLPTTPEKPEKPLKKPKEFWSLIFKMKLTVWAIKSLAARRR